MKKYMKMLGAALLSSLLLVTNASAFTLHTLDAEDVLSEQMMEYVTEEKAAAEISAEASAVSAWAEDSIAAAIEAGLVTEHTSTYMTNEITRFQFAELSVNFVELVLGEEITPNPEDTFSDTSEIAVLKASVAGIVSGYTDGTFAPDAVTNREQIAAMISRAISYIEEQGGENLAPLSGDLTGYTDSSSVSSWAEGSVSQLVANSIMSGTSTTTLSPKNSCTIEQSIVLIYRLFLLV